MVLRPVLDFCAQVDHFLVITVSSAGFGRKGLLDSQVKACSERLCHKLSHGCALSGADDTTFVLRAGHATHSGGAEVSLFGVG